MSDPIDELAAAMGIKMAEAVLPGSDRSIDDLIADGWRYLDPPTWFSPEMWDYFLSILGEGQYKILAMTKMPSRGIRGQFFISPQADENMKALAAASKADAS